MMFRKLRVILSRVDWLIFALSLSISIALSFWLRYQGVSSVDECTLPLFPDPIARDRYNRCLEVNRRMQDLTDDDTGSNNWLDTGD